MGASNSIVAKKGLTINNGKYYTVNTPGQTDAFYALYVTGGCSVTINGGEFSSPNKRTSLDIGGTSCVVSGDNDTGMPYGSVILQGGKPTIPLPTPSTSQRRLSAISLSQDSPLSSGL